jgi:hypothetical protein
MPAGPEAVAPTGRTPDDADKALSGRARDHLNAAANGDLVSDEDEEQDAQRAAVEQMADDRGAKDASAQTQMDALDWFLNAKAKPVTKTLRLNVGGPADDKGEAIEPENPPVWIDWTVQTIDLDTIKRVRSMSMTGGSRRQRRAGMGGEFDEAQFNVGIVAEATVYPDLHEVVRRTGVQDVRIEVKRAFQHKSGLIGQIVDEVYTLSGFSQNDVQDGTGPAVNAEVAAAGN